MINMCVAGVEPNQSHVQSSSIAEGPMGNSDANSPDAKDSADGHTRAPVEDVRPQAR